MKYAVVKCVNGNYAIDAEDITDIASAKVSFHGLCQSLWNAPDVVTASVAIVDEKFYIVEGYQEKIVKVVPSEV